MRNIAIKLAHSELPGKPINEVMRKANEIFKVNSDHWQIPFAQVDVEFATFVDYIRENCTQKEKDLVYVSEVFSRCWKTPHISIQTLNESTSDKDVIELNAMSKALKRLNLLHLMTNGLREDLVEFFVNMAEPEMIER